MGLIMENLNPIVGAYGQFVRESFIEAAGVFWIGAEVLILFVVTAALRHFEARPLSPTFALTAREKRRAFWWSGGLVVLCVGAFGRHVVVPPLHTALAALASPSAGEVEALYFSRAHIHLAVWCLFILSWVALEAVIVLQGLRVLSRIRGLVRHAV
jgi:hypothetical protein